jgi:hypothetical protein
MKWRNMWRGREEELILRDDFAFRLGTWSETVLELLVQPETYCTLHQVTVVCIFTIRFTYKHLCVSDAQCELRKSDEQMWELCLFACAEPGGGGSTPPPIIIICCSSSTLPSFVARSQANLLLLYWIGIECEIRIFRKIPPMESEIQLLVTCP